ncbi:MAG: hypothetical protein CMM87_01615 [Rickettsiales bacterium]|nr:hypothetical protein [Rickettsiales bacterium]|tara:strand:- start:22829 stop:23365 length:537 start_codon:yes stop_codon:yes gene_type:complete
MTTFAKYDTCYSVEQVNEYAQQQLLALVHPEHEIQLTRHAPMWDSTFNSGTDYMHRHGFAVLGESLKAWHDCQVPSHVLAHDSVGSTALTGASTLSAKQSLALGVAYEALCDGTDGMRIYLALEQCKRERILDGPKLGMWVATNMGHDYITRLAKKAADLAAKGEDARQTKRARVSAY